MPGFELRQAIAVTLFGEDFCTARQPPQRVSDSQLTFLEPSLCAFLISITGPISCPSCGANPGTPFEYLCLEDRLGPSISTSLLTVLPGARTSNKSMLPSREPVITVDWLSNSQYDRERSKYWAVLTEAVWPRRMVRRVGVGASRACIRADWSPEAVSSGKSA